MLLMPYYEAFQPRKPLRAGFVFLLYRAYRRARSEIVSSTVQNVRCELASDYHRSCRQGSVEKVPGPIPEGPFWRIWNSIQIDIGGLTGMGFEDGVLRMFLRI
jgi:hypothetical protein